MTRALHRPSRAGWKAAVLSVCVLWTQAAQAEPFTLVVLPDTQTESTEKPQLKFPTSGGAGDVPSTPSSGSNGVATTPAAPASSEGCACRLAPTSADSSLLAAAAALLAALRRRTGRKHAA